MLWLLCFLTWVSEQTSEKACVFNGSSKGAINSQHAVFLSCSYNESSRGQTSHSEGGATYEKAVWGLIVGLGLFWARGGHKRKVQLPWTFGKKQLRRVPRPVLTAEKKLEPLSNECALNVCGLFPSEMQPSRVWIFLGQNRFQVQLHITSRMTVSIVQCSI